MSKHYADEDIERGADAVFSIGWPLGSGPSCKQSSEAVLDAVAPAIAARALREAARNVRGSDLLPAIPRSNVRKFLNVRADEIEATS